MKHTLLIITALMLVVGCTKEPIDDETLIEEDGLVYHPDTKELYSGDVFKNYLGGKTQYEGSYKDGKQDGLYTEWHENGQKWIEATYKDGELIEETWYYENGQKKREVSYKDGKEEGLWTEWHENGQKWIEATYKDGERVGKWTLWYKNGQKHEEETYKDGELIDYKAWDIDGNKR